MKDKPKEFKSNKIARDLCYHVGPQRAVHA